MKCLENQRNRLQLIPQHLHISPVPKSAAAASAEALSALGTFLVLALMDIDNQRFPTMVVIAG